MHAISATIGLGMSWYDLFSKFYDRSLEPLYREQRRLAAEALAPREGEVVLDLPTGTGQSLDELAPRVGATGAVIGVDLSAGMLARAAERIAGEDWGARVHLLECGVHELDHAAIEGALGGSEPGAIDCLHVFLGLTAFPEWERGFENLWGLLRPGGRCVVVDVHDPKPGFQGKMVNLVARADIRRETWTALEGLAEAYERRDLPSQKQHGGQLFLAVGRKPDAP